MRAAPPTISSSLEAQRLPFASLARRVSAFFALLFVHSALLTASVAAPVTTDEATITASLAPKFIGAWKLIAIRERDTATGKETPAARAGVDGQLIYTANSRLSVQIIREGREKAPAGSADGFSSYFGTWKLLPAEGCVIHQQDGNINLAQQGQAAKRYYSFDAAGSLSLATPPRKRDSDGKDIQMVFVWTRLP
ncbi:hypothetical protein CMV30_12750 [Nibricoccus aquaticus]|uniref:Lipocalin-like domain-containing protein n=1 Tax=Nibricoccus aquaticus TaxID=2576891 RepID=A0A290QLB0_9BACT|nr:lipocalin-like domain-containing protein [Nibricoccus aquaticus]ATC64762.1 hypothetical protein CMV30_12750 [Nibricoccus aquaticus]